MILLPPDTIFFAFLDENSATMELCVTTKSLETEKVPVQSPYKHVNFLGHSLYAFLMNNRNDLKMFKNQYFVALSFMAPENNKMVLFVPLKGIMVGNSEPFTEYDYSLYKTAK